MSFDIISTENNTDEENEHQVDEENNPSVGETYEERFLREIETLPDKRRRQPPQRFLEEADYCYTADDLTADIDEPKNISEARNGKHSVHWRQAKDSEFASLESNKTWDLVPMPKDKNVIGCRWVFKVKRNSDGTLERYKARLVAQGYTQEHGVDYEEVFAPVVRYTLSLI